MNRGQIKKVIEKLLKEKKMDNIFSLLTVFIVASNSVLDLDDCEDSWKSFIDRTIAKNWRDFSIDARAVITINAMEKYLYYQLELFNKK